jgi:NADH-quinone oxidoreductase subunit M
MSDNVLLTSVWLLPLIGLVLVLLVPRRFESSIKWVSLGFTFASFLMSLLMLRAYLTQSEAQAALRERAQQNLVTTSGDNVAVAATTLQPDGDLVFRTAWIPYFKIEYYLGVDGISLSLVVLTGLVSLLACLASWNIEKQVKGYFALFLLLVASMMGVFVSLDLFLFYVFFEVMLLPMYFLIAIWGGPRREYAAIKFLLFTLFGSVFILVAILILYFWQNPAAPGGFSAHSFDLVRITSAASETSYYPRWLQSWVFVLFLIGFIIKLPSFPFHTWLPDAHVEAPTPISMILAGILLKVGGYGMVRMAWPLAPAGAYDCSWWVALLGVFSIIYGALVAMAQTDFKKLVAYSSVSHMGYVTLGLAAMSIFAADGSKLDPRYYAFGVNGAMYMMLAHGITSAGMFFLVGVIYDRAHTRDLNKLGGLNNIMPLYGAASYIIFFGSMGLPGLCGFVAEVFVVLSAFNYSVPLAVFAAAAVILTAGYILWTIQRVFLGRSETWKGLPDMDSREITIAIPLVLMTIVMGIYPQTLILSWMSPSVDRTVQAIVTARELNVQPGQVTRDASVPQTPRPPMARRGSTMPTGPTQVRDANVAAAADSASARAVRREPAKPTADS